MQSSIPEMLTIRQVADKKVLKEHQLRVLVKEKRIPFIMVGNKALINFTALCEQLSNLNNETINE